MILISESFVNVLQDREEGDAGGTPRSKELHQNGLVLIEDPGEVFEGIN